MASTFGALDPPSPSDTRSATVRTAFGLESVFAYPSRSTSASTAASVAASLVKSMRRFAPFTPPLIVPIATPPKLTTLPDTPIWPGPLPWCTTPSWSSTAPPCT